MTGNKKVIRDFRYHNRRLQITTGDSTRTRQTPQPVYSHNLHQVPLDEMVARETTDPLEPVYTVGGRL